VVLLAFEWTSAEKAETVNLSVQEQVIEEEFIPVTHWLFLMNSPVLAGR
jgi:hypothetical protein